MEHRRIPIPRPDRLAILPPDLIGEAIDRLIEALDQREGDVDLEDSEAGEIKIDDRGHRIDEPPLGFEYLSPLDDPDSELAGDEADGTMGEDDFCTHSPASEIGAAGCPIADPGEPVGDELDTGNAEDEHLAGISLGWATGGGPGCPIADPPDRTSVERPRQDLAQPQLLPGRYADDDAEDDDPQGERSGVGDGEGEPDFRRRPQSKAGGAGCTISDPDYGIEDQNEGDPADLLGHP